MRLLKQFLIIIAFSFAGELLHALLPLPVPASIYGIILLFVALLRGWVKVADIDSSCAFLIEIMPIMFIPAAVGLLQSWDAVKGSIAAYAAVTALSTLTVMFAAGTIAQSIIRRSRRHDDTRNPHD